MRKRNLNLNDQVGAKMAYGTELMLGFQYDDWDKTPFLNIKNVREISDLDELHTSVSKAIDPFSAKLKMAHSRALAEFGFKKAPKHNLQSLTVPWNTPNGLREFSPFVLAVRFNPHEMGEKREDATISISISGRYHPIFADWKNENGGLWPIVFSAELYKMMEIAESHIVKALPCFSSAEWMVKELFY